MSTGDTAFLAIELLLMFREEPDFADIARTVLDNPLRYLPGDRAREQERAAYWRQFSASAVRKIYDDCGSSTTACAAATWSGGVDEPDYAAAARLRGIADAYAEIIAEQNAEYNAKCYGRARDAIAEATAGMRALHDAAESEADRTAIRMQARAAALQVLIEYRRSPHQVLSKFVVLACHTDLAWTRRTRGDDQ